ncbi:MAG: 50S ribosomal protein L17 [Chlamydiia bacterium]|nr:50S ribosomal protein L17 [Chlamydiia bacterium]
MRHRKSTFKLGRTTSHRRCLIANLLKSLIEHEKIETSVAKAKELRRHADRMITLAKKNTLASRRNAIAKLMIRYNHLSSKEARKSKEMNQRYFNNDRVVVSKLFDELGPRFLARSGGYTRIIKSRDRHGDQAPMCIIEFC